MIATELSYQKGVAYALRKMKPLFYPVSTLLQIGIETTTSKVCLI